MVDEYREVTHRSFGNKIISSFVGVIVGIILFIISFPLIIWNEEQSIDRIRTLDEGRSLVIAVSPEKIDSNNNGSLVHFSGKATTNEILKDSQFGIEENALKLSRNTEMYQWNESTSTKTKENLGGSETQETTYSYKKTWSDTLINSNNFKKSDGHQNPSSMQYESQTSIASNVNVNEFKLTSVFINQINDYKEYPLAQKNFDAMSSHLKKYFKLNGNEYFYGNPEDPQIGSIRIRYSIIQPTEVSVIGKQNNNIIEPYYTKNGDIKLLDLGNVGATTMFSSAESENTMNTWLCRLAAFLLMWTGLAMTLGPIKTLGSIVPLIGNILDGGIKVITGIVAIILSFTTMALAWIFFRPLIGIALLLIVGGIIFAVFKFIRRNTINVKTVIVSSKASAIDRNSNNSSTQGKMGWITDDHRK